MVGFDRNGRSGSVGIRKIWALISEGGESNWYVYDDLTFTELWAAYHYVTPPSDWKEQFGVSDGECNLIGIDGKIEDEDGDETGWRFGVHPAIANTVLARDGMRLDMMLSVLENFFDVPPPIESSLDELPSWSTYQWYDAPSEVVLDSGQLDVQPTEGPPGSLLRVRFWHRIMDSDEGSAVEVPTEELARLLYVEYAAVQRIDRFARAVALLNWIADQELEEFPALPSEVQPIRMEVKAELRYEDALTYFRVRDVAWQDIQSCFFVLLAVVVVLGAGIIMLGLWFFRRRRMRREVLSG